MERLITGFYLDAEANWVAELGCGHRQHIYHRPPFQVRPWVLDAAERVLRLGTLRDCPLCDDADAGAPPPEPGGGEPACFAHLVCPECGGVSDEGHRRGCPAQETVS